MGSLNMLVFKAFNPDQPECVYSHSDKMDSELYHPSLVFLVSYWLNVLLFRSPIVAGVAMGNTELKLESHIPHSKGKRRDPPVFAGGFSHNLPSYNM